MAVVDDFYIGKTHITVTDDYRCKPEEVPALLDKMSKIASRAFMDDAIRKAKLADKTA
jgi:hypothetical protein